MTTEHQMLHLYEAWHRAVVSRDLNMLMELYAAESVLDSSAVLVLERDPSGIVRGRDKIRDHFARFCAMVGDGEGKDWYRLKNYLWDGKTLM